MKIEIKKNWPEISLIASNAVTIVIAVIENWGLTTVMFVYWCQNVIIGFFNVLRILTLDLTRIKNAKTKTPIPENAAMTVKIVLAGFFAVHYGAFHIGYLSFLRPHLENTDWKFVLLASAVFFVNHLTSFRHNREKDLEKEDLGRIMFFPYQRIVPMHLTIIFGGVFMMLIKNELAEKAVLVFFLILKTIADVKMHRLEHKEVCPGK